MKNIIVIFILSFNFFASAQFEGQSKKKLPPSLGIIDNNPKEEIAEESEENKESNLFEIKKPPKTLLEWRKKKPNFSFGQIDTEFVKPKYKIKTGLEQKEGAWREEYKKDQNFGDFKTESKTVKIICRDHEYVDGDRVMILMNDRTLISDMLLVGDYKSVEVELQEGFNKFEFVALNEGTSSPNTAEFRVIDDKGNNIVGNIWYITQGAKASLVVIKEEAKLKSE
jgi:hypothetical protein